MLRPRIIPCLLVKNGGLVKTVQFSDPKYVGDPINAVRIFNEKEVDELIILDIDASVNNRPPNSEMIKNLAEECRMPVCYGGGVKTVEQIQEIISLGVEKVAISSAFIENPNLIVESARKVGNQSIVVVLDIKKAGLFGGQKVWIYNGKKSSGKSPVEMATLAEELGAGEIVVNSIDQDGMMKGYDIGLTREIRSVVNIPITVLGGAGSKKDIETLFSQFGILGAAAGSLFVFKGKYRAVLINYIDPIEKESLFQCKKN